VSSSGPDGDRAWLQVGAGALKHYVASGCIPEATLLLEARLATYSALSASDGRSPWIARQARNPKPPITARTIVRTTATTRHRCVDVEPDDTSSMRNPAEATAAHVTGRWAVSSW
jgi:hypothetical protein